MANKPHANAADYEDRWIAMVAQTPRSPSSATPLRSRPWNARRLAATERWARPRGKEQELGQRRSDDDLAEGVALADVGQRFRHLVERVGAVDVDVDVTGHAQVGQRLEVGRARASRPAPRAGGR